MTEITSSILSNHQTVNDLTFVQPRAQANVKVPVVRPGTLVPDGDKHAYDRRYLNPAVFKRRGTPEPLHRPIPAPRKRGVPVESVRAKTTVSTLATASAFLRNNWRVLVSDKHKKYTAHKGVKIQPQTFRTQSAAILMVALLTLGTAKAVAPTSPASNGTTAVAKQPTANAAPGTNNASGMLLVSSKSSDANTPSVSSSQPARLFSGSSTINPASNAGGSSASTASSQPAGQTTNVPVAGSGGVSTPTTPVSGSTSSAGGSGSGNGSTLSQPSTPNDPTAGSPSGDSGSAGSGSESGSGSDGGLGSTLGGAIDGVGNTLQNTTDSLGDTVSGLL